jgi:CheY-like chemotaxis protein
MPTRRRPKSVVLCVDDDRAILALIKTTLEHEGYKVLTATDGPAALDMFRRESIDAVVLDYQMPGMNGVEVATAMRHLKPRVPKLLFTGCEELPAGAASAVEGVCDKLSGITTLQLRVRSMLDLRGSSHRLAG